MEKETNLEPNLENLAELSAAEMPTYDWFAVDVQVNDGAREAIVSRLFDVGAQGVDESETLGPARVRGYFAAADAPSAVDAMKGYLSELDSLVPGTKTLEVSVSPIRTENWAEYHKNFYRAQALSKTFYLQPLWDKDASVPEGMIAIFMEPGQAFGTGLHPSTALALHFLEYAVAEGHVAPSKLRLLDVGTGTGILGIAASKLRLAYVEATDNDPIAVETAIENAAANGTTSMHIHGGDLSTVAAPFDLVLANILLETHQELAPDYARVLAPGGTIILSGLLVQQRGEVEATMQAAGLILDSTKSMQEWIAMAFRKPAAAC